MYFFPSNLYIYINIFYTTAFGSTGSSQSYKLLRRELHFFVETYPSMGRALDKKHVCRLRASQLVRPIAGTAKRLRTTKRRRYVRINIIVPPYITHATRTWPRTRTWVGFYISSRKPYQNRLKIRFGFDLFLRNLLSYVY